MVTSENLADFLEKILEAHGLPASRSGDRVSVGESGPALSGVWEPGADSETAGRLDIEVTLEDGRVIRESFAGIGEEIDACRDALHNFICGSLHVILAALWGRIDQQQIVVEDWELASGRCRAYIGGFTARQAEGCDIAIPEDAFEAIAAALKDETLGAGLHWVRTFFCNMGNQETCAEALLDNEDWQAGRHALSAVGWQDSEHYYSIRNFLIIDKAA